MKAGKLIALLIVAVALSVAAVVVYQQQYTAQSKGGKNAGALLLPALKDKATAVAEVTFAQNKGQVVLKRGANKDWMVPSNADYPANPSKITQLVMELAELKVGDSLTNKTDKYEKYGVAGALGQRGTITLKDDAGKELANLTLGAERKNSGDDPMLARVSGGRYLRVNEDPFVYLAQENLDWLDTKTSTWVERDLLKVPRESIVDVRIDHASTETLHLALNGSELKLDQLDKGMQEKTYEASEIINALSPLQLESVLTPTSTTALNMDFKTTFVAQSKDGTVYKIKIGKSDNKNYIRLNVDYSQPVLTSQDKETTATQTAAQEAATKAQKNAPELDKKFSHWVYEVNDSTFKALAKKRSDLMEPVEKAEDKSEQEKPLLKKDILKPTLKKENKK